MKRTYFYVGTDGGGLLGGWIVKRENERLAGFATKDEAVTYAASQARLEHNITSRPTGVRIRLKDGTFQEERSYGADPYPPTG